MATRSDVGPILIAQDRRARRRQETIDEILGHALAVMAEDGVAGLSMAAIARRLGVAPPSLYKYFGSLIDVYDALFRRGHEQNLQVLAAAVAVADPGLPSLNAGMEATLRWAWDNPVLAQLLFWRPIPGYQPTTDAFAPAVAIVKLLKRVLRQAARLGQIGSRAKSDEALTVLSVLHFGLLSQHLANEPDALWESSVYAPLLPQLISMFVTTYR